MRSKKMTPEEQAEILLQQLMHLKQYEKPDESRCIKSQQNIMRMVRQSDSRKRKSFGELLEASMPWLFAEPRYGIALLFVAFAGLQFINVNHNQRMHGQTGIYTSSSDMASMEQAVAPTNNFYYPSLPAGARLFDANQRGDDDIKFVGRLEVK